MSWHINATWKHVPKTFDIKCLHLDIRDREVLPQVRQTLPLFPVIFFKVRKLDGEYITFEPCDHPCVSRGYSCHRCTDEDGAASIAAAGMGYGGRWGWRPPAGPVRTGSRHRARSRHGQRRLQHRRRMTWRVSTGASVRGTVRSRQVNMVRRANNYAFIKT